MGRRGKKKRAAPSDAGPAPKDVEIGTSLGALLKAAQAEERAKAAERAEAEGGRDRAGSGGEEARTPKKSPSLEPSRPTPTRATGAPSADPPPPAPSATLRGDDLIAFHAAMGGARPLGPKKRPKRDRKARASRVPPPVQSPAEQEARRRLAALVGEGLRFDVEIDERGVQGLRKGAPSSLLKDLRKTGALVEATLDLHGFRGDAAETAVVRFVRRSHRQGLRRLRLIHGKGRHEGLGVIQERVIECLSNGGAAPLVRAFVTAPPAQGGAGALLVQLSKR